MTTSARTKYEPVPLPDQPPVSAGESLEGARAFFEKMARAILSAIMPKKR